MEEKSEHLFNTKGASFCVPGCGCENSCMVETVDPVTDAVATGDAQGHPLNNFLFAKNLFFSYENGTFIVN